MTPARAVLTRSLKAVGLFHPLRDTRRDWRLAQRARHDLAEWEAQGRPMPPPAKIKHEVVHAYAVRHRTPVLVETGTFYGDTIFATRKIFREIHSIELADGLFALAQKEFAHLPHIHLHHGDSAQLLPQIAAEIAEPILFWLDGHFCAGPSARTDKDTPISEELTWLLARPARRDVILIDDARLFMGADGYPTTEEIRGYVAARRPEASFEIASDIIRIAPV